MLVDFTLVIAQVIIIESQVAVRLVILSTEQHVSASKWSRQPSCVTKHCKCVGSHKEHTCPPVVCSEPRSITVNSSSTRKKRVYVNITVQDVFRIWNLGVVSQVMEDNLPSPPSPSFSLSYLPLPSSPGLTTRIPFFIPSFLLPLLSPPFS